MDQADSPQDAPASPRTRVGRASSPRPRLIPSATTRQAAKATKRVTLTLDVAADKRLADHAHLTGRSPGAIVSDLIRSGVPRYSFRQLDQADPGEDRQSEGS